MSIEHTKGRLEARKGDTFNPERPWGVVVPLSREACIEIDGDDTGYGSRTEVVAEVCGGLPGLAEADANRLVDCWNAHYALDAVATAARAVVSHWHTRQAGLAESQAYAEAREALETALLTLTERTDQ